MAGVDPWGLSIGEPPLLVSFIPVAGSAWSAINDFQNGNYLMGTINAAFAVSDVFAVGSFYKDVINVSRVISGPRVTSWAWENVRKRLKNVEGYVAGGEPVHHWGIARNSACGKWLKRTLGTERAEKWIINKPWNFFPAKNRTWHDAIEGKGGHGWNLAKRLWRGTPGWFKFGTVSFVGDVTNILVPRDLGVDCQ